MAAKRILLLDGPRLSAHFWNAGRLTAEGEFSQDPTGLEELARYLKKHNSSVFFLLADVVEEGFQLEDVPYVQGSDRAALLKRRLGQYYYNTPLSTAISLGRAAKGRRDEKMLFAALTRVETFTPWLDAMRNAESILAGVYSVPLVLAECNRQLVADGGPVLFVSQTRGGVRQSFLAEGRLHFSRLSQLATRSLDEIGRTAAAESAKIFQYLVAQRLIPRGAPLRTVVLAHSAQIPVLRHFCCNTDELRFDFLDIASAARSAGLKDVATDGNADNLFMHLLAARTPASQFAPAEDRRFHRLWQIRFALTSVAWVVFAGCVLFAGKTSIDRYELEETIQATKGLAALDERRYKDILEGLPKLSVTPDNLRALMGRLETLQRRSPAMAPLLKDLSLALNEEPKIELMSLEWKLADRPDPVVQPDSARRAASVPSPDAAAEGNWAVIEIHARLPLGLVTDQRAQIDLIERFAARLNGPKTNVRVLSRPFDIESDKALKSADGKGEMQLADAPKFSLRLARQL